MKIYAEISSIGTSCKEYFTFREFSCLQIPRNLTVNLLSKYYDFKYINFKYLNFI